MILEFTPDQIDPKSICRKNFAGNPDNFGNSRRTFQLRIAEEDALAMMADGWNIDSWAAKDRNGNPTGETVYALRVFCDFEPYPPEIRRYEHGIYEVLTASTVATLDTDEIEAVGLRIRSSHWKKGTREGISAYLQKMNVKVKEDKLNTFFEQYLSPKEPEYPSDDEDLPFNMDE